MQLLQEEPDSIAQPFQTTIVLIGVNKRRKLLGWMLIDPLITAAVAWMGERWIVGFDERGPFLLMSPIFSASIFFFLIGGRNLFDCQVPEGKPKPVDVDMIQTAALEFGFGSVEVLQKRCGKELALAIAIADGSNMSLPTNWSKLSFDAKRFAVVWALLDSNVPLTTQLVKALPVYAARAAGMLLAGFNLWLILACHGFAAVRLAYSSIWNREKVWIQKDIRVLAIVRDLNAAITYVKADPLNADVDIKANQRIAALRKAAVNMGIS